MAQLNGFSINQDNPTSTFILMAFFPLLLFPMGTAFEYSGFDIWWVSHFYDEQSHSWPFRNHWLFDTVIHDWGRYFDILAALIWLMVFLLTFCLDALKKHKKIMLYVLLASAAGPLIVGLGKQTTHIYTPWDLEIFSGPLPYIRIFDPVPNGLPVGEAFPAGHAAGGYAFFTLYFLLLHLRSPYKGYGLAFGLGMGLLFGIGQQVRGAHFPSHDLFTMAICWYAALIFYYLFYPKEWKDITHDK